MATKKEIIDSLGKCLKDLEQLSTTLQVVYTDVKYGTTDRKTVISMLLHGVEYLSANISKLIDRIRLQVD
jgi:hypothetical protein